MRSGRLRDSVEIQSKSRKKDSYGAKVDEYSKVYSAKADVRYMAGSELIKAGVASNLIVITVLMRNDRRMVEKLFIHTDGQRFEVENIKPSDDKREIIVTATRET
tara:strand:- start:34664 stop:34978 length:315 start_codon:yes stop_codon:yes gene_type:complete